MLFQIRSDFTIFEASESAFVINVFHNYLNQKRETGEIGTRNSSRFEAFFHLNYCFHLGRQDSNLQLILAEMYFSTFITIVSNLGVQRESNPQPLISEVSVLPVRTMYSFRNVWDSNPQHLTWRVNALPLS